MIGVSPEAAVYDVSNACLGVLNGMVEIANRIELGQIRAGMVVACETAREINEIVIEQLLADRSMDFFKLSLATLTGGSGAVALLLTDGSFSQTKGHQLAGRRHAERLSVPRPVPLGHRGDRPGGRLSVPAVHGDRCVGRADARRRAGRANLARVPRRSSAGPASQVDKVICHQVGSAPSRYDPEALGIPDSKDFATYPFLGNMGTVALPLTAALAEEREFLEPGDRVGFLGIGSGLNCLMLGLEW